MSFGLFKRAASKQWFIWREAAIEFGKVLKIVALFGLFVVAVIIGITGFLQFLEMVGAL
jgi:type II secretory pathway component PulL